jgi:hypothetical protein
VKITTTVVVCATAIVIALIGGILFLSMGTTGNVKWIIAQGMLGTVGTLISTLFVANKVEQASQHADDAAKRADDIHEDLKNGLIPEKVKEAVTQLADDPTIDTVTITHTDNP